MSARKPFVVYRSIRLADTEAFDGDALATLQASYDSLGLGWQVQEEGWSIEPLPDGHVFVTATVVAPPREDA